LPKIWTSSFTSIFAITALGACTSTQAQTVGPAPARSCLTAGPVQDQAAAIKTAGFTPTDKLSYGDMVALLASCLGAPDTAIRDRVAYEGLTHLLRSQLLSPDEMRALKRSLLTDLQAEDPDGYLKPFATLVLAEVVRADRVEAYLTTEERAEILDGGISYFTSITDYRGFDDAEGWRHGIAHGADLLMQASLNPYYGKSDHLKILDALAAQITTENHAYVHGEGERLARPILFIARAGTVSDEEWETWFQSLVDPAPLASWGDAFSSEAALKRLHNIKLVLFPALLQVYPRDDTPPILPGLMEAVVSLP